MAGTVTDAHRITYYENVVLALQERKPQFERFFNYTSQVRGKQVMVVDLIGTSEARINAPEGGDTPDIESTHEPVWMKPTRIDWGKLIKQEDAIKALTDFKSQYVQSGVNGVVRAKNGIMATAIFGPRLIGNEVPVSTAWAGRTVPVDYGTTGTPNKMSVKKILNAMRLMEQDKVVLEEEEMFLVLDPEEMESLWNDVTHVSKDFRDKAQLDDISRRVMSIFGIPIAPSERLANVDANTSTAALAVKSGFWWGEAMPLTTKVSENVGKQYRLHPYIETWLAATRSEDLKAVKILNKIG